ncbi:hypothetical protein SAMN02800694_2879 [Luteibacter sp. UNCMF331Sha3.1]|uniref:hypothetical protein n=1 Tax=Luteibacter sp. UNCMF331Sha3.1 TaxID=1502760 RepID=UPI0008C2AF72|nr:hypothetical protein [Luteibacter sp. UNCMF331Sha3.1]SEN13612.1 hypothetical protein SAMN02800694_2879 [Luteibacter sp. UNCMF331Sha3.1]
MTQRRRLHPPLWLCLLASPGCFASGGSYLVDDGAIAPPSHCQLESWLQFRTSARSVTSVPACSWGAVEFSAQLATGAHVGGGSASPGVKWQFASGPRLSAALAVGTTWQRRRTQTSQAYVASTFLPDPNGRWAFNVNLGAVRPRGDGAQRLLGGGVEFTVSPSLTLLAEVLDTAGTGRTWQTGVRLPFGDDSIDLVVGRGLGDASDRWINMGVNLAF